MAEEISTSRRALLLIPDISGFTDFVTHVEINHGQAIIQELLETLIDANAIGLKVAEIEGDAVFFYRPGDDLPPEKITQQIRNMFVAFHQQIGRYERSRICDCGACTRVTQLTLKFVVHQGVVASYNVRGNDKLYGPDVILVHRLLKNNIPEHEYMLATAAIPLERVAASGEPDFGWMQVHKGSCAYDLGTVDYNYVPFSALHDSIPPPPEPEVSLYRVRHPLRLNKTIHAPVQEVYQTLINLPERVHYMAGVNEVAVFDEPHNRINRLGTRHQCIAATHVTDVITSNVVSGSTRMSFSETATDMPMTCDYMLEQIKEGTRLSMVIHLKVPLFKMLLFRLFEKKKVVAGVRATLTKIKEYCERSDKL